MLVLTRKPGQSLYIGDDVKITLKEVRGNQVRLGIDAPPHVRIFREEIYLQILEENQSAAGVPKDTPADLGTVAENWKKGKSSSIAKLGQAPKQVEPKPDDET